MSKLKISKRVANERVSAYTSLGWNTEDMRLFPESPTEKAVSVTVKTANNHDEDIWCELKNPYLIQRAKIRRPFHEHEGDKLTSAVSLDYMGAAEFEFGALPQSLRRIQVQFALFTVIKVPEITILEGKNPLRVYANFDSDAERDKYVQYLLAMRRGNNEFYLHEATYFDTKSHNFPVPDGIPEGTDFWWDIRNDVMWSFDHKFMEGRLQKHLQASFAYMNEMADAR